ncbi:hypothetical protein [Agrococcus beijingensis]|uniref:hypothetical protein n=1 Tax=Agrococcus beijingensis TaxID=3068634 RepID=UPI002741B419|nr:hypothetical protein [Agrococcus sp. REN33]
MSIAPTPVVPRSRPERAFLLITMLAAAQFGWVFLMGLLAGGKFQHAEWPRWEPLLEWPVLPIPAWVTIALGVAAVVAAAALSRRRRAYAELPVLVHLLILTLLLLVGLPFLLAGAYASEEGLAAHWIAALPQVITVVLLGARIALTARSRGPVS